MIWLIGNKGMLGKELSIVLEKEGLPYLGTDKEVDIVDLNALKSFALQNKFNWIINCAAYTAVDKAEDDETLCRSINTIGATNIAQTAKENNAYLVHFSTDYVFNGQGKRPYTENDSTDPIGVYGLSKRDSEELVLKENPSSYIMRTSWLYGEYGNNFVNTMIRLMKERDEVKVVNDQIGSPTWSKDLAELIVRLVKDLDGHKNIPYGIYHYSNEGDISWFTFAEEIYRLGCNQGLITSDCVIKPCSSDEFPAKVKRPSYSVLDKKKIEAALDIKIPVWNKSLLNYLELLANVK